ncbi:BMP family lipoprotein [Calidifontibacillus oryziterrae]|uniref:BMP family lipoprotein n=1 Tax=Calidifontibacillus oryziterrae TaxID=1191699 RepID=UPI0002E3259C|nr:BMP family protein [Calidifontibacillus oryziterrae]
MVSKKAGLFISFLFAISTILGGCGTADNDNKNNAGEGGTQEAEENKGNQSISIAMVTDEGGIDDRSFNQSAWEGIQAFGKKHNLEKGKGGYDYLQSNGPEDFKPNLNKLARNEFDVIFATGFAFGEALTEIAQQFPEINFAVVDAVVEQPNVTSVTFKEHEGSFLVGVAAGLATTSNKVGFIGGKEIPLIEKFETGYIAGVKAVKPDATVEVQYADSWTDEAKGKQIASSMYASGVDVIYHAAGGVGNGLFSEAVDIKKKDPAKNIYAIGVDRDQWELGCTKWDENANETERKPEDCTGDNIALTSMVKRVDVAVQDIAEKTLKGEQTGGQIIEYGIEEDGIDIAPTQTNISDTMLATINEWKTKIINGDVKVPQTRAELK